MKDFLRDLVVERSRAGLDPRNVVREYLQARVLGALQREGAMMAIAFHGGTALRFLYGTAGVDGSKLRIVGIGQGGPVALHAAALDKLVGDCLEVSKKTLAQANPTTPDEIYAADTNLITLPPESDAELAELEKFLLQNFYLHESILQTADKVKGWLQRLFDRLCKEPELMPGYFQHFIPQQGLQRTVCDYIAGMTDRFAIKMVEEI